MSSASQFSASEPGGGQPEGGRWNGKSVSTVFLGLVASLPALFLLLGDSGPLPVIITLIVVRGSQFILILVGAEHNQEKNLLPKRKHGTRTAAALHSEARAQINNTEQ